MAFRAITTLPFIMAATPCFLVSLMHFVFKPNALLSKCNFGFEIWDDWEDSSLLQRLSIVFAATIVLWATPAHSERPILDIAGVEIGYTPAEVTSALSERRYTEVNDRYYPRLGPSFEDLLAATSGDRLRANARSQIATQRYQRGDQYINVLYSPYENGPRVTQVFYYGSIRPGGEDCANFMQSVRGKYGQGYTNFANSALYIDRPYVNGNAVPGQIRLKVSCDRPPNLSLSSFGFRKDLNDRIQDALGPKERAF